MNDVLLINRIDPDQTQSQETRVSFILEGMQVDEVCDLLIQILADLSFINLEEAVIKYNGIDLLLPQNLIPDCVKALCQAGLRIYGVYASYE